MVALFGGTYSNENRRTGPATVTGSGTTTFSGVNTYIGGTILSSGTLAVAADSG